MNIVEFALKFKDLASRDLQTFGNSARQTFTAVNGYTRNVISRNRVLGQSYTELQNRIKQVEQTIRTSNMPGQIRAARRELAALQRQAARHPGNSTGGMSRGAGGRGGFFGEMAGALGLGKLAAPLLIAGAVAGGVRAAGAAVNKGLERQQIQTSFNVLAGDDKEGTALTKQLVKLQKDTILGAEVFKNAQTMMAFGFAANEVNENLRRLGDVSMGNVQRLEALTLAFSQVRAAGRLTGQDLLQFVNAGFNPLQEMVRTTGKSMAVLRDEMSKGLISFEQVQEAFKTATSEGGKFNDMLGIIARTPAGMKAQLQGAWQEIIVGFGEAMMPLYSILLKGLQKALPVVEKLIQPLAAGVQKVADWIRNLYAETQGWGGYVETVKNLWQYGIWPVLQKVGGLIFKIVGSLIQFISKSALLQDIFKLVGIIVSNVLGLVGMLIDGLSWVYDNVVLPILNAIEKAYRLITGKPAPKKDDSDKRRQGETNTELLSSISRNTAQNTQAAGEAESTIAGGGQKIINISVSKFFDNIIINPETIQDGLEELEERVSELFARVLAQGAANAV